MGLIGRLMRGAKAGSLGRMDVPGTATVELPAGEVLLSWEEKRNSFPASGGDIMFYPPEDLAVSIRAPGGEEIKTTGKASPPSATGFSWKRSRGVNRKFGSSRVRKDKATARYARYKLGKVQVPAAGEYRLEATATLDRESTKAELLLD